MFFYSFFKPSEVCLLFTPSAALRAPRPIPQPSSPKKCIIIIYAQRSNTRSQVCCRRDGRARAIDAGSFHAAKLSGRPLVRADVLCTGASLWGERVRLG